MTVALASLVAAAALLIPPAAGAEAAQEQAAALPPLHGPKPDLTFVSMADESMPQVKVAHGVPADKKLWPAVVIDNTTSSGLCSATLIGPRVVLTAAHCVDAEKGDASSVTIGGTVAFGLLAPFTLVNCAMHPKYAGAKLPAARVPRAAEDWALCELDRDVDGILFETLAAAPAAAKDEKILLMGYGCTKIAANDHGVPVGLDQAGNLNIGDAKITSVDVSNAAGAPGAYVAIRASGAMPVICPGDSGGPAFRGISTNALSNAGRKVVGVNSKVSAVVNGNGYDFVSYLAPVTSNDFIAWLAQWQSDAAANKEHRRVCGSGYSPANGKCKA